MPAPLNVSIRFEHEEIMQKEELGYQSIPFSYHLKFVLSSHNDRNGVDERLQEYLLEN